jgi:hypothetical protein
MQRSGRSLAREGGHASKIADEGDYGAHTTAPFLHRVIARGFDDG